MRRLVLVAGALACASVARAQGNLSTQGFGWPQGQMSTRALGTAGAIGEIDPASTRNPAAISLFGGTTLVFQIEPEYRRVVTPGRTDLTTTNRYPLILAAIPIRSRGMFSVSASTLLDRTWETTVPDTQNIGGERQPGTTNEEVNGSISDLRFAGAYTPATWLSLGMGVHFVSGSNEVTVKRTFEDSARFGAFADTTILSYNGAAVSFGAQMIAGKVATLGVSYRVGGSLKASRGDTTLSRASVPDRFGVTLAYVGIQGTTIAARTGYDKWTDLQSLGGDSTIAHNAWDSSVGADIAGPRFAGRALMLRTGFRWRTLPFEAIGNVVNENSASFGVGSPFANGRVLVDVTAIRAWRSANINISEHAWTFSIGLSAHP
jgi:hypothetical protein